MENGGIVMGGDTLCFVIIEPQQNSLATLYFNGQSMCGSVTKWGKQPKHAAFSLALLASLLCKGPPDSAAARVPAFISLLMQVRPAPHPLPSWGAPFSRCPSSLVGSGHLSCNDPAAVYIILPSVSYYA